MFEKVVHLGFCTAVFESESADTRHGFKHSCSMHFFQNEGLLDDVYSTANVYYYNRTWECYRYQTVIRAAVSKAIKNRREELRRKFLSDNNYRSLRWHEKDFQIKIDYDEVTSVLRWLYHEL